jgi:hypothetical protein
MTTTSDARSAETFAREQRMAFAKLMKVDAGKAIGAPALGLCSRIAELAESDPLKWDEALKEPPVAKLFACGALYFGRAM